MQKTFEITEHLYSLPEYEYQGEKRRVEINRVSWFGKEPKIDIRAWSENLEWCGKGVTLSQEEWESIKSAIKRGEL